MVERGIAAALEAALKAVTTSPEHAPTVALARRYAEQLDDEPELLARLGRPFLAVLVELRLTPRARAGVLCGLDDEEFDEPAGGPGEGGADRDGDSGTDAAERDPLDELRSRRDRRVHGAAAVDPAAP